MRIAYGVFGYGRGHATRALAVLPALARRHDVTLFAGGDAYDALSPHYPVVRIPTLRYCYGDGGSRSMWRTFRGNARRFSEVVFGGRSVQRVAGLLAGLRPEVAICDAEPWTHAACARLGIPRISFDHFGVLSWCKPEVTALDRAFIARDVAAYRLLVGRPDRVIVSSFFDAPPRSGAVKVIAPLLRAEVHATTARGAEHLLVYLNQGRHQLTPRIEDALHHVGVPVVVYGAGRSGPCGNLTFRPPADRPFLDDLARSIAVVSTAGNQLVGEAMHFGKPMLVMPENTVEQRVNALALERMGLGEQLHHQEFDLRRLSAFLGRAEGYAARAALQRRDGRAEAVAALEQFAGELSRGQRALPAVLSLGAWRFA